MEEVHLYVDEKGTNMQFSPCKDSTATRNAYVSHLLHIHSTYIRTYIHTYIHTYIVHTYIQKMSIILLLVPSSRPLVLLLLHRRHR